jgi:heme a synthase
LEEFPQATAEGRSDVSWPHRFASLVAVMAFLLIPVGALVSGSSKSAIIPPSTGLFTSRGFVSAAPARYAHLYYLVAATVIVLTFILAFRLRKSDSKRYIKRLANVTVLLALAVAIAVPALSRFSAARSFVYLLGIQAFFCLTVSLALFTRSDWRLDHPKARDLASPSLRGVIVFMTGALFLLPLLGESFYRRILGIAPHFVLGVVVTLCAAWVLEMALSKFQHLRAFKMSAILLAELVGLELFLGIVSYSMELNAAARSTPQPGLVVMKVTHAAVGALVLAASLFVTFQAFKYLAPAESSVSVTSQREDRELTRPQG